VNYELEFGGWNNTRYWGLSSNILNGTKSKRLLIPHPDT
jgi:hypothetical protein